MRSRLSFGTGSRARAAHAALVSAVGVLLRIGPLLGCAFESVGLGCAFALVVGLGLGEHQAAVDRKCLELDREAPALLMRPGGADASPDRLLVAAAILHGIDVEG